MSAISWSMDRLLLLPDTDQSLASLCLCKRTNVPSGCPQFLVLCATDGSHEATVWIAQRYAQLVNWVMTTTWDGGRRGPARTRDALWLLMDPSLRIDEALMGPDHRVAWRELPSALPGWRHVRFDPRPTTINDTVQPPVDPLALLPLEYLQVSASLMTHPGGAFALYRCLRVLRHHHGVRRVPFPL